MALIVILLPAVFALSAFAINIAHIESANTEVQIAADSAVRAASRAYAITGDEGLALAAAKDAASRNPIGDFVLPLTASDLEFGVSIRDNASSAYQFSPSNDGSGNSVRLVTHTLANSNSGLEPLFPFFGAGMTIRPLRTAVSTQGVIDVALVVDRSGSMAYSADEVAQYPPLPAAAPIGWDFGDPVPADARWLDLIAAVNTFNTELNESPQTELLSLSTYNHESVTNQKLTEDYSLVTAELNQISMQFDAGGTSIGRGMLEGLAAVNDHSLSRPHASKVMVLMTDGVQNYGNTPDSASWALANSGVTLFTVTFSDEADQTTMERIAERCGGQHFHAVTAQQLQDAFRDIASRLPTLITQ
ncbi:von Willebrand factor type A domain protein [Rubripirellula obstinata]|uniref:von Willebrand factor type A domain protein n=2 Tax=Rubripirellula obstinata TaxID=406547 RepID=A0A5B1CFZ6_9BACT|nr:VWA domain-containing protein [Rubripirellula obstinata]KAA1259112.1 von Willebrand factor type A domain protein [Rubripirellula obstinata]